MLDSINARLSIGVRLTIIAACFLTAVAVAVSYDGL